MNLEAPDEHQLLVFWTQLLVLLLVARVLGAAMRRINQPAIVGQLGAGLLLGPSVLGRVAPGALEWLVPADDLQSGMLFAVSWIGVLLLLIETGFETDLSLIRRLGRATALVSAGSVLLPLAVGLAVGAALPPVFVGALRDDTLFVLFIAAALSISSLAVAGKVLGELGFLRRDFGQVTIAAGMANDVIGWIMLGVLASLAAAGELAPGALAVTVTGIAVLYVGGLTIGQRAVDVVLRELRRREGGVAADVTAVLTIALVFGVATQLIGAEAVLGAFVAGIVINRSRYARPEAREVLEPVTAGVFAPIFFATAGLRVDLGLLADGQVLTWTVIVIVAASTAKLVGSYIGSRLASLHPREGVLLGVGLNPRGTLEIVIATVGLSLGVLAESAYTAIMVMTVVLSMAAPPLLRALARSWEGSDEEQARLRREAALAENLMVRPDRVLLPTLGGPNSIAAAKLLHLVWPSDVRATILKVGDDVRETGFDALLDFVGDRDTDVVEVPAQDAADAILAEARLGYGVIGLGAPESAKGTSIVSPVVDALLSSSPVPLVVVRRARDGARPRRDGFASGVIAVAPDRASRAAQEIGFNLSANAGTEMVLVHVVAEEPGGGDGAAAQHDVAGRVMGEATARAAGLGAAVRTVIEAHESTTGGVLRVARACDADVVIMGAELRRLEGRPFLGHTVEQLLATSDATVVVVAMPSTAEFTGGGD